jgi:uncharacterized protein YqjF (DUF2071 family)
MNSIFLTAEWRKLAIINYSIDPNILSPYIPFRTELDLWDDKCYVSLVGFRFLNTKLKGINIPFHINFEEINLRFYVRCKEGSYWKRGVTFIKEIVPKPALTIIANTIYKEKYITLPTRHEWIENNNTLNVSYGWKHKGDWDSISLTAELNAKDIMVKSEEEFITEHYWGYTPIDDHLTSEYQVEHPRWKMYPVINHKITVRFGDLYGVEFGFLKDSLPDSVMLAEGSRIAVRVADKLR